VFHGTVDPTNEGDAGDFYINTASNTLFGPKDAVAGWPAGVTLVGPAGAQGPQGPHSQPGTPSGPADPQGSVGDFLWDDNYIYVKTNVGWKRAELDSESW